MEIGSGSDTINDNSFPFFNEYKNNKSQSLYYQNEIGTAQTFAGISFNFYQVTGNANDAALSNFTITIMHTNLTTLPNDSYVDMSAGTVVFEKPGADVFTPATTTGWATIPFDSNFDYNGTDNLLIQICWGREATFTDNYYINYKSRDNSHVRSVYGCSDTAVTPPNFTWYSSLYSNIRLQIAEGAPIFSSTPASVDFGVHEYGIGEATPSQTVTVSNSGSGTLTLDAPSLTGTDADQFTLTDTNTYPVSLNAGQSISLTLGFAPTALGTKTANLTFSGSAKTTHDIPITGIYADNRVLRLPYTFGFEVMPRGWTQEIVNGYGSIPPVWTVAETVDVPTGISAHGGANLIYLNSGSCYATASARLESPHFQLPASASAVVHFWMYREALADSYWDNVVIQVCTDGSSWLTVSDPFIRPVTSEADAGWHQYSVDLTPYVTGSSDYRIGFLGVSGFGCDLCIDDISVTPALDFGSHLFISEVADNHPGQDEGTGYIEIGALGATHSYDLSGLVIRQGTDSSGNGTAFIPNTISYILPTGTTLYPEQMLIIANGADEATFKNAWGLSGDLNYITGTSDLGIASGYAYDLYNPNTKSAELDASPNVSSGDFTEQDQLNSWGGGPSSSATPGEKSTAQTLAVQLSGFTAVEQQDNTVKLSWIAQSETDMLGYNLLRATTNDLSGAMQVNTTIIQAVNTGEVSDYRYIDISTRPATNYYYWIELVDLSSNISYHGPVSILTVPSNPDTPQYISTTRLLGNGPNPFRFGQSTQIAYSLKGTTGTLVNASLVIYNIRGQVVKTLFNGKQTPGERNVAVWNGTNDAGQKVGSGMYFYKLTTDDYTCMKKAVLMK